MFRIFVVIVVTVHNYCHHNLIIHPTLCIYARVNNKEEKRVLNALYTPYKMFSESHVPGIQKNDQSEHSIQMVRCGRVLECKLTQARFRPKARADHNIK